MGVQALICPACHRNFPERRIRLKKLACPNCEAGLQPVPHVVVDWFGFFCRVVWCVFFLRLYFVGGRGIGFWEFWCAWVAIEIFQDVLSFFFPPTKLQVVEETMRDPYIPRYSLFEREYKRA